MVIGIVNQKGGVGKTTVAVNLAGVLADRVGPLLLVDADPQGSVLQWASIADESSFDILHTPKLGGRKAFARQTRGYPHVVIDAPPAMAAVCLHVMALVDLLIVPVGPSPLDIWSTREIIGRLPEVRRRNRKVSPRLLISRKMPRTRVGKDARVAMENLEVEAFGTEICQRVAYVEAMIAGLPVHRFAPASAAAAEMQSLCDEVREWEKKGE